MNKKSSQGMGMTRTIILPTLGQKPEQQMSDPKEELLTFNYGERPLPPNWCILGKSRKGMMFSAKQIMFEEMQKGREVIIIDPERDYAELVERFGNDTITPFDSRKSDEK